jgi:multicomponent Na+:H+ antiporter subunit D
VTAFFGKSLLDGGALELHYPWLPTVFVISSILTGGAVLRAAGRVFFGWGASERQEDIELRQPPEQDEERIGRDVTPPLMLVVPAVLLLGAVVVGLIPGVVPAIERAAAHFTDHAAYATWVLRGHPPHYAAPGPSHIEPFDYAYAAASTLGALAIAALTLFGAPLRGRVPTRFEGPPRAALTALRRLHSGHIGDYIAWWTVAAAMLGGASLILLT